MKRTFCLLISIAATSCELCEDEPGGPDISGSYRLKSAVVADATDINGDGIPNRDLALENGCYAGSLLVLERSGNFSLFDQRAPLSGQECQAETIRGSWRHVGHAVYLEAAGQDLNGELTEGTLTINTAGYAYPAPESPAGFLEGTVRREFELQ